MTEEVGVTDHAMELAGLLTRVGDGGDAVDWKAVEQEYGTSFPQDYMEFVANFGDGSIEEMLWIAIPVSTADPLVRRVDRLPQQILEYPEANEWEDPAAADEYRLEDVLVWGETSEADVLGWIANGPDPEEWPLAVFSRGNGSWSVYHCTMSEFIVRLLRSEFERCPVGVSRLSGLPNPRFLHTSEEARLKELGINPWSRQ